MHPSQSNTLPGAGSRPYNSSESLVNLEGRLVNLVDGGSIPELALPTAVTDLSLFVVVDGNALDTDSDVIPVVPGQEIRIRAKSTGSAGAILVHADPSTPADKGKVRTVPATEGVYFSPGVAAEDFVDGQLVKVNPLPRLVHVGAAFTVAAPAATAATSSTPFGYSEAQANAILTNLIELRAWAVAQGFKATA